MLTVKKGQVWRCKGGDIFDDSYVESVVTTTVGQIATLLRPYCWNGKVGVESFQIHVGRLFATYEMVRASEAELFEERIAENAKRMGVGEFYDWLFS